MSWIGQITNGLYSQRNVLKFPTDCRILRPTIGEKIRDKRLHIISKRPLIGSSHTGLHPTAIRSKATVAMTMQAVLSEL